MGVRGRHDLVPQHVLGTDLETVIGRWPLAEREGPPLPPIPARYNRQRLR